MIIGNVGEKAKTAYDSTFTRANGLTGIHFLTQET